MTAPIPADLAAAYAATVVTIDSERPVVVSIGNPAGALDDLLEANGSSTAVVITAWNPFSEPQTPEGNAAKNAELLAAIVRARLSWTTARGSSPDGEWFEDAFCIFDVPEELLNAWLVMFGQNAAFRVRVGGQLELVWNERFGRTFAQ